MPVIELLENGALIVLIYQNPKSTIILYYYDGTNSIWNKWDFFFFFNSRVLCEVSIFKCVPTNDAESTRPFVVKLSFKI